MGNSFVSPTDQSGVPLNAIYAEHILQLTQALSGMLDVGQLSLLGPVANPMVAPSVSLQSGNLTGDGYQWGFYWITGVPDGTGNINITGRTLAGTLAASQQLSTQEAVVSLPNGIAIPTGVKGWGIVRNQAGGSTWYIVPNSEQFINVQGTMPTTFTDNTPDSNLVTAAPSANTTGTTFNPGSVLGVINQNLLFNGGFGLGLAGWTVKQGSAWEVLFGQDGPYAISSIISTTGTYQDLKSTPIPVAAGLPYTVSGILDSGSLSGGPIYLNVDWYSDAAATQGISTDSSTVVGSGNAPTQIANTFVAPAGAVSATVTIVISSAATGKGRARKIKFEYGSVATTFSDDSTLNTVQYAQQLAGVFSGVDSWHSITPTGGWSAGPYNPRYRKDANGFVHLDGGIVNGTVGAVAFTLPAGYRPSQAQRIVCSSITQSSLGDESFLSFGADGTCTVKLAANTGAGVSLSGILFLAEN